MPVVSPPVDEQKGDPQPDASPAERGWRLPGVLLAVIGCLAVGLAFLGAFLPLLPTAPFVLVAGACFARAWPPADRWLHDHRIFGPIRRMRRGTPTMTRVYKFISILVVVLSFGATIWLTPIAWVRVVVGALGVAVVWFLARQPTLDA